MRKLKSTSLHLSAAFAFALLASGECPASDTSAAASGPAAASLTTHADEAPRAPDTRITEAYARMVARNAYFWAWPMVNTYNRRLGFSRAPAHGLIGGIMPIAPLNRLAMLTGYVDPTERLVACPNQDVVYGAGVAALDDGPVVIQIPDFGERFWMVQIANLRTDSVGDLGSMYGTKPGFYLLAGPDWHGTVPEGITQVIRSGTRTAIVVPRVFQADTQQDNDAIQPLLNRIDMYPLAMYDGTTKQHDWRKLPTFPMPVREGANPGEARVVFPERFFDQLPAVLRDAPPMPGEEARYAETLAVIAAANRDPSLKAAMIDEARRADKELVDPLLQFGSFGIPLSHNWTTQRNGARFGTDYFTRTAVARSNIFVNKPEEATYFYLDLDSAGTRLNARNRYTVTFAKGQLPPVKGFWSLTMYDAHHFFAPNPIGRYAIGTRNEDLKPNADGSLTVYVQPEPPADPAQRANWLPSPREGDFSLMLRAYWPAAAILSGDWTPPAVQSIQ